MLQNRIGAAQVLTSVVAVVGLTSACRATFLDDIGYTALQIELGASTPDGSGVRVAHIDAGAPFDTTGTAPPEFSGKTFIRYPSSNTSYGGHSYSVAAKFYGTGGVAPGVQDIELYGSGGPGGSMTTGAWGTLLLPGAFYVAPPGYSSNPLPGDVDLDGYVGVTDWSIVLSNMNMSPAVLGDGDVTGDGVVDMYDFNFIMNNPADVRIRHTYQPNYTMARVGNHSYGFTFDEHMRTDFLDEVDDMINVMAADNASSPTSGGSSDGFNSIYVGLTSGNHWSGTSTVTGPYVSGRVAPTVVAPDGATSYATGQVSGIAADLVQAGHGNTSWSNGSYTSPRTGLTIYHAETSEVIKAAIMAGADRGAVSGYAATSNNNLDTHYGAGQVNVYNAYHILAGKEQDSSEEGNTNHIRRYGFDYQPTFSESDTASYWFTGDLARAGIAVTLMWNVGFAGGTPTDFDETATLYHFNLKLYDLTVSTTVPLHESASAIDNTQNIYALDLVDGHNYKLVVEPAAGQDPFTWDYGLAWRFLPDSSIVSAGNHGIYTLFDGDADGDGSIGAADLNTVLNNYGLTNATWNQGDFDGNGIVDAYDLNAVMNNYGATNASAGLINVVPEPTLAGVLLSSGLIAFVRTRRVLT